MCEIAVNVLVTAISEQALHQWGQQWYVNSELSVCVKRSFLGILQAGKLAARGEVINTDTVTKLLR
jgi:hypothetical protein